MKWFGAVDELVRIVTGGVPVHAEATGADLECAIPYGNHPSQCQRAFAGGLENIGEEVRGDKCLVIQKSAAH